MRTFSDGKVTELNDLELLSVNGILLHSKRLVGLIRYGFRSKPVEENTFRIVGEDGRGNPYRLTITLDSLASSRKNENGMTAGGKTTASTGENIE